MPLGSVVAAGTFGGFPLAGCRSGFRVGPRTELSGVSPLPFPPAAGRALLLPSAHRDPLGTEGTEGYHAEALANSCRDQADLPSFCPSEPPHWRRSTLSFLSTDFWDSSQGLTLILQRT